MKINSLALLYGILASDGCISKYGITRAIIEINFSDKNLFNLIQSLGFSVGKKGKRLYIPKIFNKYYKDIISGYFATKYIS